MNKLEPLEELGKGLDYLVKQSVEFNQIKLAIFQLQKGIVNEDNGN